MTSIRPYRPAYSYRRAAAEITAQAGSQFDPELVMAFGAARAEIRRRMEALGGRVRAERAATRRIPEQTTAPALRIVS